MITGFSWILCLWFTVSDLFESLKGNAVDVDFGSYNITVASLGKIIKSKKAIGRPRDMAVIEILERILYEKEKM
jgi:hypothetical protein